MPPEISLLRDAHLLSFAVDHPWAITPGMLEEVARILSLHAAGVSADDATLAAALVKRRNLPQPPGGGVAIIPAYGVIAPRANLLSSMSGGTSFESLAEQLAAAMADPHVSTIVFDVDSPGGSVAGATEFAAAMMSARRTKPIIAQANFTMASAAYWFATGATHIHASPSALLGSVGVFTIHNEISKALAALGVTRTYITAGKYKAEANETQPLDPEARARIQASVDHAHDLFLKDISKGRGTALAEVRTGYGEGRLVTAEEALALGMVDEILTLEQTVTRARTGAAANSAPSAATLQEPSQATSQERRRALQRQAFEVELASL